MCFRLGPSLQPLYQKQLPECGTLSQARAGGPSAGPCSRSGESLYVFLWEAGVSFVCSYWYTIL